MPATRFSAVRAGFVLVLACSGMASCITRELSLEEVIARHIDAVGGADLLESVHSIQVDAHLTEPEFEVDVLFRALRPGLCRVDVSVDGQVVYREAYDGETAREQPGPGRPVKVSGAKGTAALRRSAVKWLYGLHELPALGYTLALVDPALIDGVTYHTVRITHPDGHEELRMFHPVSFLQTRGRAVSAIHAEADPSEKRVEGRHAEFREFEGILRPTLSEVVDRDSGVTLQTERTQSVRLNVDFDPSIFTLAEEE